MLNEEGNESYFSIDMELTRRLDHKYLPAVRHQYMLVYCGLLLLVILTGIVVNFIVIAAYKFGHKKFLTTSNVSVNLMNKNAVHMRSQQSNANQIRRMSLASNDGKNLSLGRKRHELTPDQNGMTVVSYELTAANKTRHTLCSYFILSLGCCDLFICLLVMPVILAVESSYLDVGIHSDLWCKLAYFLGQIPIALEIEILLTIAVDRYTSVFHPIKFYFFDREKSKLTLVAQIVVSVLLSLPNMFFYASVSQSGRQQANASLEFHSLGRQCGVQPRLVAAYSYYQLVLFACFLLSLLLISVFYLKVYKHVYIVSRRQRIESIHSRTSVCFGSQVVYGPASYSNTSLRVKKIAESSVRLDRTTSTKEKQLVKKPDLKNIEENDLESTYEECSIKSNMPAKATGENVSFCLTDNHESIELIDESDSEVNKPVLREQAGKSSMVDVHKVKGNVSRRVSCPVVFSDTFETKIFEANLSVKQLSEMPMANFESSGGRKAWSSSIKTAPSAKSGALLKRLRRFSESYNTFKKQAPTPPPSSMLEFSSSCNNSSLFRRHTTRIFKHGKTARSNTLFFIQNKNFYCLAI